MNPFVVASLLWLFLALLAIIDSALAAAGLAPWFNALRWLRVHFLTLGVLAELGFGLLPRFVAAHSGRPEPAVRWDIWLTLNSGIAALLVGITLVNGVWIVTGGSLVFLAAVMLLRQLLAFRNDAAARSVTSGVPFYAAGVSFLLLGIVAGTGLLLGWGPALQMVSVREVHIHANAFGFLALVFAGLIVGNYTEFTGRTLAWPSSVRPILWLMTAAAALAVVGPWLGSLPVTGVALALELAASGWLLANVALPLRSAALAWTPGLIHLMAAYVWMAAPLVAAPFVLTGVTSARAEIESAAPHALIYGWGVQLAYAFLPFLVLRFRRPDQRAELGGTWLSVLTLNLGTALLWAGIFATGSLQANLYAAAYLLWAVSLLPMLAILWRVTTRAPEPSAAPLPDGPSP